MSSIKKLFCMSEETVLKLDALQTANPDLSASEIVSALILLAPSDMKIEKEKHIVYKVKG